MEPCDETWEPIPADLNVSAEDPNVVSMGGGKGAGGEKRQALPTGETMTGTLKTFNMERNYGFIDAPEARAKYGNDVWVHGNNLNDSQKQPGVTLSFQISINDKGQ